MAPRYSTGSAGEIQVRCSPETPDDGPSVTCHDMPGLVKSKKDRCSHTVVKRWQV